MNDSTSITAERSGATSACIFRLADDPDTDYWGWQFINSATSLTKWSMWLRESRGGLHSSLFIRGNIVPDSEHAPDNFDVGTTTNSFNTMYARAFRTTSDYRHKKNIEYISQKKTSNEYLNFIKNDLNIATYEFIRYEIDNTVKPYKDDETQLPPIRNRDGVKISNKKGDTRTGFMAQELITTDIGKTFIKHYSNDSYFYDVTSFIGIVSQALKEEIIERESVITSLEARISKLEKALETLIR